MKWEVPLKSLLHVLPEAVVGQIKDHIDPENPAAVVRRKGTIDLKGKPLDPGEKEVLQYISTRDIDRDDEILNPAGCILTEFKKAPQVLWGHDYSIPPVGSDRLIERDGYGIRAVTRYADTPLANDLWSLRRDGHLNTSSVGFIPTKIVSKGEDGWTKLTEKLAKAWDMDVAGFEGCRSIVDKWLLLEHSDVSVPSNINARTIAVGKDAEAKELEQLCLKGAISTPSLRLALEEMAKAYRIAFVAEQPAPAKGQELEPERRVEVVETVRERRIVHVVNSDWSLTPPAEKAKCLVLMARGQLE